MDTALPNCVLLFTGSNPSLPPAVRQQHTSVSWDMDCYIDLLRKARQQDLHPGICHSHPNSAAPFSRQDDENEAHLRDLLQRRNRNRAQVLASVLLRGDGQIEARVWHSTGAPEIATVRVLGSTFPNSIFPRTGPTRQPIPPTFNDRLSR